MKLYVRFLEHTTGGVPVSDEPYSERSTSYTDHTTQFVSTKEMAGFNIMTFNSSDDFVSDDIAHIVRVTYSTGDTFGQNCGRVEYVDAFKDGGAALRMVTLIKTDNYKGNPNKDEYVYVPWRGYFEDLEKAEILTLRLG